MTRGYGTMDYEIIEYRADKLVKVSILVNGAPVEALSLICHRENAGWRLYRGQHSQPPEHPHALPGKCSDGTIAAGRTAKLRRC